MTEKRYTICILLQGYTRENIYYLSPDTNVDGDKFLNDVDADATYENVFHAVNTWAKDPLAHDLLIYIVDHGGDGTFRLNADTLLTAEELDAWLDDLQKSMTGKLIFIYDACQSDTFLPLMIPPVGRERIVITSALDENAYFMNQGGLSFSYQFWSFLFGGSDLYDAFVHGKNMMKDKQTALIDANADSAGNQKEDKTLANNIVIGRGWIPASDMPYIADVSDEQTLYGETSATLRASSVIDANGIQRVWAVITPPRFNPGSPDTPITDLPTVELPDSDNDNAYEGVYDNFTINDTYNITIYAMDTDGVYSLPSQTTVIQTVGTTANATIFGRIACAVAGHDNLSVINAIVSLKGTEHTATTDSNGMFAFENVPPATYTLTISSPDILTITKEITLSQGQSLEIDLPIATVSTGQSAWDVNGDNKLGLRDIIYGLQILSGVR